MANNSYSHNQSNRVDQGQRPRSSTQTSRSDQERPSRYQENRGYGRPRDDSSDRRSGNDGRDRRQSNDKYGRDSRQIERWETVNRIVDRVNEEGVLPIRLTVSIERPIFTNGDEGYCRVNATIGVGNYYVRLATKGLISLLDMIAENRKAILDAVDSVRILNEQKDRASRQNGDGNREPSVPVKKEDYPLLDDQRLDRSRERGSRERSRTRQTRNDDDRRR